MNTTRSWARLRATALGAESGVGLIEALVAMTIFLVIAAATVGLLVGAMRSNTSARNTTLATEVAQAQIEKIRALPYSKIGTTTGNPTGSVTASQTATNLGFTNFTATVKTSIAYAPGGVPGGYNQTTLYKKATVEVDSGSTVLAKVSTFIAPTTTADQGGQSQASISLDVLDTGGSAPVPATGVTITLTNTATNATVSDTTDSNGEVSFPGLAYNATGSYTISVPSGYGSVATNQMSVTLAAGQAYTDTIDIYQYATINLSMADSGGNAYTGTATVTVTPSTGSPQVYSNVTVTNGSASIPNIVPGTYSVSVLTAGGSIASAAAQVVPNAYPTDLTATYTLTLVPQPKVSSIVTVDTSPTNAATVHWTVTFNVAVVGVSASNFALVNTGSLTGGSITSVSGSGATYTVTASSGSGSGTLGLNQTGVTGVTDASGNALSGTYTGQTYTIDTTAPTVTNVTSSLANGTYGVGQLIPITVTFSKAVTVTGTPQLTLATAGATNEVVNYVSGSGTTTLTFNYTVATGDASADLNYLSTGALALNGGTIKDSLTNAASLTLPGLAAAGSLATNKAIVIVTPVAVASIVPAAANPTNAASVTWTVTFSRTVTGVTTGRFSLVQTGVSGAAITAVSGSGTTYTVTATTGSGSGTLGLNLSSPAGITDTSGNTPATFTGQTYTVDRTAPTVSGVSSTLTDGSYTVGQVVPITVTFSESVNVTGTPQLTLATTPTNRVVNYSSGSGTSTLTFTYTVQATDTSADLNYVATTSLALNGGTINDLAGNAATLTLPGLAAAGSLGTNKNLVIDTTAPTVTVTVPANSGYATSLTPTLSGAAGNATGDSTTVTVKIYAGSGTGGALLQTLTPTRSAATWTATAGSLGQGIYTVQATQTDLAGNIGTSTANVFTVDTIAPSVSSIVPAAANPSNAATVTYTVTFSEAVTGLTTAKFSLAQTGVSGATVSSISGSGTTWTVTVATGSGDGTLGLNLSTTSGVTDLAGNTLASTFTGQTYTIQKTAPTVTGVSSTLADGSYTVGQVVPITVSFSNPVTVTGTPQLTLATTPTNRVVNYASGSGTNTLTFNYTVQATDTSADLNYVATTSLALNSGTIKDAAGNVATLTLPGLAAAGSLGTNKALVIDTTTPTVTLTAPANSSYQTTATPTLSGAAGNTTGDSTTVTVTIYAGSGTGGAVVQTLTPTRSAGTWSATAASLGQGTFTAQATQTDLAGNVGVSAANTFTVDTIAPTVSSIVPAAANPSNATTVTYTVTFSEAVTGVTTAKFALAQTGVSSAAISSVSGSGTTWTVTANTGNGSGTLGLNLTTTSGIIDVAGNTLASTFTGQTYTIDKTAPTVSGVSSTLNGYYTVGQVIPINVAFSEPVNVTGTPQLTLATTPTNRVVNYASGSGTSTLTFNYTVQATDTSADLNYVATTSLALNSGTIKDLAGNAATLTLPAPAGAGSLGTNNAIVIDTTAPTASTINATPSPQNGVPDSGDTITLTYSEVMSPSSILAGWDGTAHTINAVFTRPSADTQLAFQNASPFSNIALGSIDLGDTSSLHRYLSSGSQTASATMTMTTVSGKSVVTIVLNSNALLSAQSPTSTTTRLTWTPSATATDLAGNAATTGTVQTALQKNF